MICMIRPWIDRLIAEEDGPTTTDYAVLLACVLVAILVATPNVGSRAYTAVANLTASWFAAHMH